MSQSATFYLIDKNDFSAINKDPEKLDLLSGRNDYVLFAGTHEGLRFVLSKGLAKKEFDLINEIFSPATFIGDNSVGVSPDADEANEFLDVTEDEAYDDFEREAIFYLAPDSIKQIALVLDALSIEEFLFRFDPDELNEHNIYPGCWMKGNEEGNAYNERQIFLDFKKLKALFEKATVSDHYLLCFVG